MIQKFELVLKNEKRGLYNRITLFILILNFIFFVYGAIAANQQAERKWFIFGAVVILLNFFISWYRNTQYSPRPTGLVLFSKANWSAGRALTPSDRHLVFSKIKLVGRAGTRQSLYSGIYVAIIFSWVLLKNYWLAAAHLILLVFYLSANKDRMIRFTPAHIYLSGTPEKKIEWKNVSNVIIKDGILTLDFKNNKLLQAPVKENWTSEEEKAFNAFCHAQINIRTNTAS